MSNETTLKALRYLVENELLVVNAKWRFRKLSPPEAEVERLIRQVILEGDLELELGSMLARVVANKLFASLGPNTRKKTPSVEIEGVYFPNS